MVAVVFESAQPVASTALTAPLEQVKALDPQRDGPATSDTVISIHLEPRDTNDTITSLENTIEDLRADHEYLLEKQRAGARGIKKDLEDHEQLYDALRNTPATAFDTSMYLTTRADDAQALASATDDVATAARRAPANLMPVAPRWTQLAAVTAGSPLGVNRLQESLDPTTPMLADAVGAMFPFVAGSVAEPGIPYGSYTLNESPLIIDRFNRETGYCMMVIGKLGAGKSFASQYSWGFSSGFRRTR